jgi:hypothetical protein
MKRMCVLFAVIAALLVAAGPVGRITSSGDLRIAGSSIPATAAAALPVVAGDTIATSAFPAVIVFSDRSRVTIEPNSRVQLEPAGASVKLRVLSGSAGLVGTSASADRATLACKPKKPPKCSRSDGPGDNGWGGNDHGWFWGWF